MVLVKEQTYRTQGGEEENGDSSAFDEATMKTDEPDRGAMMEKRTLSEYGYVCSLHLKELSVMFIHVTETYRLISVFPYKQG